MPDLRRSLCLALTALGLSLATAACGPTDGTDGDGDGPVEPEDVDVTLTFAAFAGDDELRCGSDTYSLGTGSGAVQLADLRFFVTDIELLDSEGNAVPLAVEDRSPWQGQDIALVDLEDGTGACSNGNSQTNATVTGTVPDGTYDGVRFSMSVPTSLNHEDLDTQGAPLNVSQMFWAWQSGYKFLRAEFQTDQRFNLHIGSTGCTGDPLLDEPVTCSRENRLSAELTGQDPLSTPIVLDLGALLAGSNLDENAPDTPSGCMGAPTDPDCGPIYERLGVPVEGDPTDQVLFRW